MRLNWQILGMLTAFTGQDIVAATYHVATNGMDTGAGTLEDPFLTIQMGIDTAQPGDTVTVLPGSYSGPGNNNLHFDGKAITLTSLSGAEETILDGTDNTGRAIELSSQDTTNLVIMGLTIYGFNSIAITTNGEPYDPFYSYHYGAYPSAVICTSNGGAFFSSCRFIENHALTYQAFITIGNPGDAEYTLITRADGRGGAIHNAGGNLVLSNCLFAGNMAGEHGGAIYSGSNSVITAYNSTWIENAGGLHSTNVYSTVGTPIDNYYSTGTMVGNRYGGGALFIESGMTRFENCTFEGNHAGAGGAIYSSDSITELTNCVLRGNSASQNTATSLGGGAVYATGGQFTAYDSSFQYNGSGYTRTTTTLSIGTPSETFYEITTSYDDEGPGGAVHTQHATSLILRRCLFMQNIAHGDGGGIYSDASEWVDLEENTFYRNNSCNNGGAIAILNQTSNVQLASSLLELNDCTTDSYIYNAITIGDPSDDFYQAQINEQDVTGSGGGVYLFNTTDVLLQNSVFNTNSASQGSAIALAPNCHQIEIISSRFSGNGHSQNGYSKTVAIMNSGAYFISDYFKESYGRGGGVSVDSSDITLSGCIFLRNLGSLGSALYSINGTSRVERSIFAENSAHRSIAVTNYIDVFGVTTTESSDVVIHTGNGLAFEASSSDIVHGTIKHTGVYSSNALISIINSILWSNTWAVDETSTISITNSIVSDYDAGPGNSTNDPLLAYYGRLLSGSPAIDAAVSIPGFTNDFEGEIYSGTAPDIGADEFSDTDNDQLADAWELLYYNSLATADGSDDSDADEATTAIEYLYSTSPTNQNTNGENIPDGWLITRDLNPHDRQQYLDPDNDRFTTFAEYITDTDPLDSTSFLFIYNTTIQPDQVVSLTWTSSPQRWYSIEMADEEIQTWTAIASNIHGNGQAMTFSTNALAVQSLRVTAYLPAE